MNIGDVITTATEDELDALPVGTVLHAQSPNVPARCDVWVRWPYGWKTDGLREPEDRPTGYLPMTVLALPGRLPRPERVVKAEAWAEGFEAGHACTGAMLTALCAGRKPNPYRVESGDAL